MKPMQDLDLQSPAPAAPDAAPSGRRRSTSDRCALWLHRQAERFDLVPEDFGKEAAVDEADGGALAREWLRQARLWADYNPEEMLALKVGAALLGGALLVLIVLVRALT